ncbi:MAG TPA: hypothetical protein VN624_00195 [Rhodanobacter sp.]|nr:hypothetical protein [Rhodanobacter sp.]
MFPIRVLRWDTYPRRKFAPAAGWPHEASPTPEEALPASLARRFGHRFGEGVMVSARGCGAHPPAQVNFEAANSKRLAAACANLTVL